MEIYGSALAAFRDIFRWRPHGSVGEKKIKKTFTTPFVTLITDKFSTLTTFCVGHVNDHCTS